MLLGAGIPAPSPLFTQARRELSEKPRTRLWGSLAGANEGGPVHFALRILAKVTLRALLAPLFGRSRKRSSRKFVYQIVHNPAPIDPRSPPRRPPLAIAGGELVTRVDRFTGSWIVVALSFQAVGADLWVGGRPPPGTPLSALHWLLGFGGSGPRRRPYPDNVI
jgi:hypothetical protein